MHGLDLHGEDRRCDGHTLRLFHVSDRYFNGDDGNVVEGMGKDHGPSAWMSRPS